MWWNKIKQLFDNRCKVVIQGPNQTKRTFNLRRVITLTNTRVVGIDLDGNKVEYQSTEKFNYELVKFK